jgi:hypothetical protein
MRKETGEVLEARPKWFPTIRGARERSRPAREQARAAVGTIRANFGRFSGSPEV